MKYFIIFLSCLFLLTGCGEEKIYDSPPLDSIKIKTNKLLVFEDTKLKDVVSIEDKNIELVTDNYTIDTETIGIKDLEFIYIKDKKKYLYKFSVNVVDEEAPRVFSGTSRSVKKGYTDDLCSLISYGDNYDGFVKCEVIGNVDVNVLGTYNVKFLLTDSSDNKKEVSGSITVHNNTNKSNTTASSRKTPFVDILAKYKNDNNEIGIDVSKWQGEIDFQKVKNAGCSFVMMRIGVQKSALGELSVDQYYERNIKLAKEAGLKVGVYLYSIATSKDEAIEHAKWVLKTLNNEELDLPIVFDWENWSKWNTFSLSFHDINSIADSYIKTVKDAGYEGMLYSSKFYLENIWENKNNNLVWLAHYTDKTSYAKDYMMWQLSNTGRIDGINGDVDIDILYKK